MADVDHGHVDTAATAGVPVRRRRKHHRLGRGLCHVEAGKYRAGSP
ncbi:hypothetical protein [Amycolatopsis plumensis]